MEPSLDQERKQAHALLDLLTAEKLNAVLSLLEVRVEPLSSSLALAPVEEENSHPKPLKHRAAPVLHSLAARASPSRRSSASST